MKRGLSRGVVAIAALALSASLAAGETLATAIYLMDADGGNVRKLIDVEDYTFLRAPNWSPDGNHLLFSAESTTTGLRECFVVSADGTGLRKIGQGDQPDWSPDGKQIVYQEQSGQSGIAVQNFDGKGTSRLGDGFSPRWSPDGRSLAVCTGNNVQVRDMISGEQRALLADGVYGVFKGMDWSPDGKHLAVAIRPQQGAKRELVILDTDKESQQAAPRLQNAMGGQISYSPDGKRVVFANGYLMYFLELDKDEWPRLIPGQRGKNMHPAYSPDGKTIAFASDREE
ncbi:MAG: hypothetical protein DWQ37_11995 [Planctomycetota bacterium]|nr:MAG: hypothetical protein DWQ37_11995 [Planctomycetota bacterium]